ncbi:MAG TPA: hypothetical protein VKZ63_18955 [Kofleriaceae bacterium]|nr:hypothetical protein [Kofleriaceae bacterium]
MACRKHHLAAAAALLLSAAAGCKDDSKGGGGGDAAKRVAAVAGMSAIPASADVVLGADVAALAGSELVQRAVGRMLLADPGLSREVDQLFEGCGFRPERDLRTVLLAMDSGDGEADRTLLVATGTLKEGAIASCVARHMASVGGRLSQKAVGGRPHYHADAPPDRLDVWFAFGAPDTVVVSSSPELLAEALGEGARVSSDAEMAGLIDRARQDEPALWAAGRVAPEIGAGLKEATGGAIGPPVALFGHIGLTAGLKAELGVVLSSPEEASSAVSLAKQQLAFLAQVAQKWKLGALVTRIQAEAKGPTVHLRLALDQAELAAALAPIDSGAPDDQTTAPLEKDQGVANGQGDAAPGGEAPVPEQGQAD